MTYDELLEWCADAVDNMPAEWRNQHKRNTYNLTAEQRQAIETSTEATRFLATRYHVHPNHIRRIRRAYRLRNASNPTA